MQTDRKQLLKSTNSSLFSGLNKGILIFAIVMLVLGSIMIFDASIYRANQYWSNQFHFLQLHLIWILVSLVAATVIYMIDYRIIARMSIFVLIANIALLILVLIVGENINGAKRWMDIGGFTLQPAELIKLTMIIYLSAWLSQEKRVFKDYEEVKNFKFLNHLFKFLGLMALVVILVLLEPDLGTATIIAVSSFIIFFLSGSDKTHRLGSILTVVVGIIPASIFAMLQSYRLDRVKTFFNSIGTGEITDPRGTGYQMQQIFIAVGSNGLFGVGFGKSRQIYGYLVENTAFTDSIFVVILEELGIIGAIALLAGWIFFLWCGIKVALKSSDRLGQLMAAGITIWLTLQALLNILVTLCGIALLLNISRNSNTAEPVMKRKSA